MISTNKPTDAAFLSQGISQGLATHDMARANGGGGVHAYENVCHF